MTVPVLSVTLTFLTQSGAVPPTATTSVLSMRGDPECKPVCPKNNNTIWVCRGACRVGGEGGEEGWALLPSSMNASCNVVSSAPSFMFVLLTSLAHAAPAPSALSCERCTRCEWVTVPPPLPRVACAKPAVLPSECPFASASCPFACCCLCQTHLPLPSRTQGALP